MRAPMRVLAGLLLGLAALAPGAVRADDTTATPRYTEWQSSGTSKDLQAFVAKLKAMVDEADKAKAADPVFIQDLRDLIASASATTTTTPAALPTVRLFYDNFSDGNFTSNPVWKVTAGQWSVDILGSNTGMKSTIIPPGQTSSQNVKLNDVLGAILQPQTSQGTTGATYASIYTAVKITNVFKLSLQLLSKEKFGRLDIGPYQGSAGNTAYRVTYFPNGNPGLALQRVTPQGQTTLASYNQVLPLEGDKLHLIELLRDGAGTMTVSVDGKALVTAKDTTITKPFDGLLMINSGGRYVIRSVQIDGTN
ncbi:hypothetical protein FRZ61_49430 [Hypericibacter adhaerens]|uniref:3-keto-disaccharide hydrolase domain-containing protein n=2 Tax=Hypericibacter adhaerens TaxID=2602016 RepID=A0A5J6N557_9PROT|nr:hypothetical protein FRZ61_49430 [Hypericibacter adhaerens]